MNNDYSHIIVCDPAGIAFMRQQLVEKLYRPAGVPEEDLSGFSFGQLFASALYQSDLIGYRKMDEQGSYHYTQIKTLPADLQLHGVNREKFSATVNTLSSPREDYRKEAGTGRSRHGDPVIYGKGAIHLERQHFDAVLDWMEQTLQGEMLSPRAAISRREDIPEETLLPNFGPYTDSAGKLKAALCEGLRVDAAGIDLPFQELLALVVRESHIALTNVPRERYAMLDIDGEPTSGRTLGYEVLKLQSTGPLGPGIGGKALALNDVILSACGEKPLKKTTDVIDETTARDIGSVLQARGVTLSQGETGPEVSIIAPKKERKKKAETLALPPPETPEQPATDPVPVEITTPRETVIARANEISERVVQWCVRDDGNPITGSPDRLLRFLTQRGLGEMTGEGSAVTRNFDCIPHPDKPGMLLLQARFSGNATPLPDALLTALDDYEKQLPHALRVNQGEKGPVL
jgi:hypothetical protein